MGEGVKTKGLNTGKGRGRGGRGNGKESALFVQERRKKAAKRLAEKSDIDAGLTKAQAKTLAKVGKQIEYDDLENGITVDSKGNITSHNLGGLGSVRIEPNQDAAIHNHPGHGFYNRNSIAGRIGTSFSGADLKVAIFQNKPAIRAKTKGYVFNMKRPKDGWNANPNDVANYHQAMLDIHMISNAKYYQGAKDKEDKERRFDRIWTVAVHKANKDTAKRFGFKYTRKKTK